MGRLFSTGDTHGQFSEFKKIKKFCKENNTTKDDCMIILGDVGCNYWLNERDTDLKKFISKIPITFLCIHGNHECRPRNIESYLYTNDERYGALWYEIDYPNILFLDDGEHFINGKRFLVASGAYSIDKYHRVANGLKWFEDEQMDEYTKYEIKQLIIENNSFDYILTHTVPLNYEPRHLFLNNVDQHTVDKSMEKFLQWIYDNIDQDKLTLWLCAHYHDDSLLNKKIRLMFNDIIELE